MKMIALQSIPLAVGLLTTVLEKSMTAADNLPVPAVIVPTTS